MTHENKHTHKPQPPTTSLNFLTYYDSLTFDINKVNNVT